MNIETIVSISALMLAIASPVISSFINGHYRKKELEITLQSEKERRQQAFYDAHRAKVIEGYISAVGKYCGHSNTGNKMDVGEHTGEIYLYVDEDLWPLLDKISETIENRQRIPSKEFNTLCKRLAKENVRPKQ